jgi:hypothetical protein
MAWPFALCELLANQRIAELQLEAERARLAARVETRRSPECVRLHRRRERMSAAVPVSLGHRVDALRSAPLSCQYGHQGAARVRRQDRSISAVPDRLPGDGDDEERRVV